MEQIKALINKLQEQIKLNAAAEQLLENADQLVKELERLRSKSSNSSENKFTEINARFDMNTTLNDTLKREKVEVLQAVNEGKITNLYKAIELNQRFVFIRELFNGNENLYEQTIKTINQFATYNEAVTWMEKELSIPFKWDQTKTAVQEFYELIKRRFS